MATFFGFAIYECYVAFKFFYSRGTKNEPIYATIPLKRMAKKSAVEKNPKVELPVIVESPPRPISPTLPMLSFADRIAKFETFFSRTKKPALPKAPAPVESAHVETAKIHKPYVSLPSFVFGENTNEVNNDTFFKSVPLGLENVVFSQADENYVPPSSLPNLPPLIFQTFKRPNCRKVEKTCSNPVALDFDAIELAPN